MAAVVAGVSAADTANNAALTTGSFTPAAGDLLVAFAWVSGQTGGGTFSDSQSLGWTNIVNSPASSNSIVYAIANALAAASSMTVTFTPAGSPTSTGITISVLRVSGMARVGSAASLQSATGSGGNNTTPAPAFASNALTTNPTVGGIGNVTNPAGLTPPTNWTERHDIGYATPTTGLETVSRDSGFTGTTITWGSQSSLHADVIGELDASAYPPMPPLMNYHQALLAM